MQKRGTCVFSDGNMAWRSLCAKNNIRNHKDVHQVKEFTRPLSVQHGKKNLSTLAGTQCVDRTWKALPVQKEVDERSTHKVPVSLFRTPSLRMGLA
jgi:hypothetical protein